MKMKILSAILLLGMAFSHASTFNIDDARVVIELPDGWKHNQDDTFGFHILPDEKSRGVRIHLRSSEDTTLIEALNSLAQSFGMVQPKSDKRITYRLIEIKEVESANGVRGLRATTGIARPDGSRVVLEQSCWHYLFINSEGRALCVCLYNTFHNDEFDPDEFILTNIEIR